MTFEDTDTDIEHFYASAYADIGEIFRDILPEDEVWRQVEIWRAGGCDESEVYRAAISIMIAACDEAKEEIWTEVVEYP